MANNRQEQMKEITERLETGVQSPEKEQIRYEEVEIFGLPALYSETPIAREDIPEGLNSYQLRGSDEDPGEPATVENFVRVNHAGTILTFQALPIPLRGYLPLDDGLNFTGEQITVQQYQQRTSEPSAFELEETVTGQIANVETAERTLSQMPQAATSSGRRESVLKDFKEHQVKIDEQQEKQGKIKAQQRREGEVSL